MNCIGWRILWSYCKFPELTGSVKNFGQPNGIVFKIEKKNLGTVHHFCYIDSQKYVSPRLRILRKKISSSKIVWWCFCPFSCFSSLFSFFFLCTNVFSKRLLKTIKNPWCSGATKSLFQDPNRSKTLGWNQLWTVSDVVFGVIFARFSCH